MKNLIGSYPKVGIRPIIDGRRKGIRESLEGKTTAMAQAVADLISANLRYPDGTPVQCCIADQNIGGVAEAARCEAKFEKENVGLSISVTPCWCYGTETIDMHPTRPKAIFGFNGTERPGAVYLAAALAAHNHRGLPAFSIYGHDVQDLADNTIPEDVAAKILSFARAGLAVAIMRGKSYLSMGTVAMGIAGSIVNDNFLNDYLGMRTEYVDMCEFDRRIEQGIYDKAEFKRALAWVKEHCPEDEDIRNIPEKQFSRKEKDKKWEYVVKMVMIARDLMEGNPRLAKMGYVEESNGHNAIAAGFQGQRQWTDFRPNGDFMEAMLNSSFDWNGIRAPYIMATENDSYNGLSMLLGYLLTNAPSVFADVRTYWSPESVKRVTGYTLEGDAKNGIIHLINSGAAAVDGAGEMKINGKPAMKPFWEISEEDADKCLKATVWSPADNDYFRGGGYSSRLTTKGGMPVTMLRLNNIKGLGPVLQIAEGWSCDLPAKVHKTLMDRTDPTWPCTWFAPRLTGEGAFKDVYSVMANWGANHGAFCYGHVGADVITLASMLRIPVSMHNVPDEKIFRPSAWSAFGTKDLEGADYRACANFGPLYYNK